MLKSMAVGFYDGGNDDGDNGGNDPLIRELDLDDVVSRVPPELLEPSQPPAEPEEMTRLQILGRVLERESEWERYL